MTTSFPLSLVKKSGCAQKSRLKELRKYPPAKPGALELGPLKAAQGRPTEEPYEVSHTNHGLLQTEFPAWPRAVK